MQEVVGSNPIGSIPLVLNVSPLVFQSLQAQSGLGNASPQDGNILRVQVPA